MAQSDERMDMISSAIRSQAEQQSREIIQKANTYRDTQLSAYTEQLINDMYDTVQSTSGGLRQKKLSDISRAERDAYHALLRRREELTKAVFDKVAVQLREFAATPEYSKWLLDTLASQKDSWDHAGSVVRLREADMPLAAEIAALLPGAAALADDSVEPGGFVLENHIAGIRVDETLTTRLARQKSWFLQNCGFRVQ